MASILTVVAKCVHSGYGISKLLIFQPDNVIEVRDASGTVEMAYDDANRPSTVTDGTVLTAKAIKWEFSYDWLDRLVTVNRSEAANVGSLPGTIAPFSAYTYDAADNRIEFEVPDLVTPTNTPTFKYHYDDADNITLIEKKVGSGSYASFETFTPADDDGNMTSRTRGGVTTTYTWDDFNRLAAISTSDGSKKQSHTFGVSGFRRKKKDKNDVETTEYAAGLATAISKATGGETITYLMDHRIMGFERSSDGAAFYFICDSLSTVRDLVNSSGSVVASYEFAEYGQKISPANTGGVESQKTFVGGLSVQDEVADTGLMMMGHRFYDPGLMGRFINRDPIGFSGGLNPFEYSSTNPVTFVDPSGLDIWAYQSVTRQVSFETTHSGTWTYDVPGMGWMRYETGEAFVAGFNKAEVVDQVIFEDHGGIESMQPCKDTLLKQHPLDTSKVQLLVGGQPVELNFSRVRQVRIWSCDSAGGYRPEEAAMKKYHMETDPTLDEHRYAYKLPATEDNLAHSFAKNYPGLSVEGIRGTGFVFMDATGEPVRPDNWTIFQNYLVK
jgi:RHS repeat-associated protein